MGTLLPRSWVLAYTLGPNPRVRRAARPPAL